MNARDVIPRNPLYARHYPAQQTYKQDTFYELYVPLTYLDQCHQYISVRAFNVSGPMLPVYF